MSDTASIDPTTAELLYSRTMRSSGSMSIENCQNRANGSEIRSNLCSRVIAAASSFGTDPRSGPHSPNGLVVR